MLRRREEPKGCWTPCLPLRPQPWYSRLGKSRLSLGMAQHFQRVLSRKGLLVGQHGVDNRRSRDTAVAVSPSWDLAFLARGAGWGGEGALLVFRAGAFCCPVAPSPGGISHLVCLHHVLDVILKGKPRSVEAGAVSSNSDMLYPLSRTFY